MRTISPILNPNPNPKPNPDPDPDPDPDPSFESIDTHHLIDAASDKARKETLVHTLNLLAFEAQSVTNAIARADDKRNDDNKSPKQQLYQLGRAEGTCNKTMPLNR